MESKSALPCYSFIIQTTRGSRCLNSNSRKRPCPCPWCKSRKVGVIVSVTIPEFLEPSMNEQKAAVSGRVEESWGLVDRQPWRCDSWSQALPRHRVIHKGVTDRTKQWLLSAEWNELEEDRHYTYSSTGTFSEPCRPKLRTSELESLSLRLEHA